MTGTLSEAQAAAVLKSMEDESGLFQLRVRGYSPWRLLRFTVGLLLQNLPLQAGAKRSKIELLRACLHSIVDLVRLPRNCRYAVKSYSSALRIRGDLGYEDQYYEALLQGIPGGVRLYSSNSQGDKVRQAAWRGPQVDITALIVASALLARLLPIKEESKVFASIAAIVAGRLPEIDFTEKRVRQIFSTFWWQSRFYEWLLKRMNVSTVFVANTSDYSFLKAAKHSNCLAIELQHGIFSPHHPDALPAMDGCDVNDAGLMLPDIVAAYGDYWVNIHANTLLGRAGRIRPCGASFIERMRAKREVIGCHAIVKILVTTQGLARNELIALINEFLTTCSAEFTLIIKLHPAYDVSPSLYLDAFGINSRVKVISGNEAPDVYQLITDSDLHISISSACHYDAIGLGVPTVVLALPNHEMVLHLVADGEALLVQTGLELSSVVENRSWISMPDLKSEKYYKKNFLGTISGWMA